MKLKLEDLQIDSFETTTEVLAGRGTVEAHMNTRGGFSCPVVQTCPECASPVME